MPKIIFFSNTPKVFYDIREKKELDLERQLFSVFGRCGEFF